MKMMTRVKLQKIQVFIQFHIFITNVKYKKRFNLLVVENGTENEVWKFENEYKS